MYTNEAMMAAALNLQPDGAIGSATLADANIIQLSGVTLYPGQTLAIDYFSPPTREVATVQSVNGQTVTLMGNLMNAHPQGAPVKEVTSMTDVVSAASRYFDDVCYAQNSFDLEQVTETRNGIVDKDGNLIVSISKILAQSISSLSYVQFIGDTPTTIVPADVDISNRFFVLAQVGLPMGNIQATITYTGGLNPIPGDIQRATTVLACRMWKEKDSGFSDVIGSSDTGILQYKKGLPNDVALIVKHYQRWVP